MFLTLVIAVIMFGFVGTWMTSRKVIVSALVKMVNVVDAATGGCGTIALSICLILFGFLSAPVNPLGPIIGILGIILLLATLSGRKE